MKDYAIYYRGSYAGVNDSIVGRIIIQCFCCHAESKVDALMQLVNLVAVHQVISVERLKNDLR